MWEVRLEWDATRRGEKFDVALRSSNTMWAMQWWWIPCDLSLWEADARPNLIYVQPIATQNDFYDMPACLTSIKNERRYLGSKKKSESRWVNVPSVVSTWFFFYESQRSFSLISCVIRCETLMIIVILLSVQLKTTWELHLCDWTQTETMCDK